MANNIGIMQINIENDEAYIRLENEAGYWYEVNAKCPGVLNAVDILSNTLDELNIDYEYNASIKGLLDDEEGSA